MYEKKKKNHYKEKKVLTGDYLAEFNIILGIDLIKKDFFNFC